MDTAEKNIRLFYQKLDFFTMHNRPIAIHAFIYVYIDIARQLKNTAKMLSISHINDFFSKISYQFILCLLRKNE